MAFNAIGNADVIDQSFSRISRFNDLTPVLNPPDAVRRTRRDLLPRLLNDHQDIITPSVIRLTRDEVMGSEVAKTLAAHKMAFPCLVRPIVVHGGEELMLAQTPADFARLPLGEADAFYFTTFHDFCSADGYYRKYRVIFVDRVPYAYHLAISRNWLVHYHSADMLAAPWKREEEARFLQQPSAALGPRAMAALEDIGKRLDLDFAGIDFSLDPSGKLLVFEANATMLLHLQDEAAVFPYKHVHVPTIFKAFDAMLDRKTRAMSASAYGTSAGHDGDC